MKRPVGVIACDVVRGELERVIGGRDIPLMVMDYALHGTPKEMPGKINEAVSEMRKSGCAKISLAYGLCSNGTVGVKSDSELIIPRCHDCISMLFGSPARYMDVFLKYPGTYFFSDGWLRNGADPLSTVEQRYIPRLGEKKAFKGMSLEIANYKHFCLINNGVGDIRKFRERIQENCRVFNKEYMELDADLSYFEELVSGPYKKSDFLVFEPGEAVMNHLFYDSLSPAIEAAAEAKL